MKKIISVVLVFACIASFMTVFGFASDAEAAGEVNGLLNKLVSAYADFITPFLEQYNGAATEIIFETGINDFLGKIDSVFESICVAIVELVETVENLF